jgi:hypothetical protein
MSFSIYQVAWASTAGTLYGSGDFRIVVGVRTPAVTP